MSLKDIAEPRVRSIEIMVTCLLRALPRETRTYVLAEAFRLAMEGPREFHLCECVRGFELAANEEMPGSDEDR